MHRLQTVVARSFEWYDLREHGEPGLISFMGRLKRSPLDKLPPNVVTRLLMFVPDVQTLQAVVLTGPQVHEVFKAHQDSVMRSVMQHELGPGMCYARALYYASKTESPQANDACFKDPVRYFQGPISGSEARALSHYGCTAKRLAAYFSTLYVSNYDFLKFTSSYMSSFKDRTAASAQLTRREYLYFQRALFRFWVLAYITTRPDWNELPDADRLGFVHALPREEVAQIADVHMMLYRLVRWRNCHLLNVDEGLKDFPDVALQCIDDQVRTEAMSLPEGERLSSVVNDLYRVLGITNTDLWAGSKRATGMAILVGGRAHGYECARCNASPVMLWGEANWHLFRCFSSFITLSSFMPGNLRFSNQVHADFVDFSEMPHYAPVMYREILSINRPHGLNWTSDLYLCKTCLLMYLKRRTFFWYYQKKVRAGPLKPDCPNGWSCNLLAPHILDHDEQYNHLCRPNLPTIADQMDYGYIPGINPWVNPDDSNGYVLARSSFGFSIFAFVLFKFALAMFHLLRDVVPTGGWWWIVDLFLVGFGLLYEVLVRQSDNA